MKTQFNKFKKEQTIGNKVTFIYLLIFGIIAFGATDKNFWSSSDEAEHIYVNNSHNTNSKKTDLLYSNTDVNTKNSGTNFMVPLSADLSVSNHTTLELNKLEKRLLQKQNSAYHQMLYELANIEEPELLIEDILAHLNNQSTTLAKYNQISSAQQSNTYLMKIYHKKNDEIKNELRHAYQLKLALQVENESSMNVENWMTDANIWKLTQIESKEFKHVLSEMYAHKNTEVLQAIKTEMALKELAAPITEEPLAVENWMIDEKCWCPEKKQHKNWYTETFAVNNQKSRKNKYAF